MKRIFRQLILAWACLVACGAPLRAQKAPPASDIFQDTNLLRIAIEIPEEGMQALRNGRGRRGAESKAKAEANVSEGGQTYTKVTVQLKGFTTLQPIDGLPSLTLNFNQLAPKQKFHGLKKISLNNSLQDVTRLHEKFSREMFAAAGVPVPRADYAVVTLNGRELGLYVLVEGFDRDFLSRHFKRTDGNLYEGGALQDIDRPLQVVSGSDPTNQAGVQRLLNAAREPDPEQRFRALEAALDLDRFLSMIAVETLLCHSDSYSMNRNNYRLYHDPTTDKIVFLPHDMDRVLGTHRSALDLPVVPPSLGLVARAVLSTTEGRRRYIERAGVLFTNLFQPDARCRRVHEIDARISAAKSNRSADRRFDPRPAPDASHDAENLCARISERAAELNLQFAHPEWFAPTPVAKFDSNGVMRIDGWRPKARPGQPVVTCTAEVRGDKQGWHLRAASGALLTSLRARVSLPVGTYRLTGEIKIATTNRTNSVPASLLRYSSNRFGLDRQRLSGRDINFVLQISEARAPEEMELNCDLRDDAPEVWFDASSLRLTRLDR